MYAMGLSEYGVKKISGTFEIKTDTMVAGPLQIEDTFVEDFTTIDKQLMRIGKVEIQGNNITGAAKIIKLLNIRERSFYTEKQIDDKFMSLKRFPFFKVLDYSMIHGKINWEVILRIKIKENKLNNMKLTGGYNPHPCQGRPQ